ncbi:hypothetical protein [Homoserinimonas aerilata]|uniref:hypothetical protein n=1 Tax=Homoserinimonas aerilata TaxID=1162970 RepID=UPI00114D84E3|nr:hypothetical protein [Homoserinimonas aerilata]
MDDVSTMTVIGGMVPATLTTRSVVPHQGTIDVDILLELGPFFDRDELDFGWLEDALVDSGFISLSGSGGWQWEVRIDELSVILEFICDVPDGPGLPLRLPGTRNVSALNFAGPGPAAHDAIELEIRSALGAPITARFAGLGGYLLAKATAVVSRALEKDFYDLAFVVLRNDNGGPMAAGRAAAAAVPANPLHDFADIVRQATAKYMSAESEGPLGFVASSLAAGDPTPSEILAQDAVTAMMQFGAAFEADHAATRRTQG